MWAFEKPDEEEEAAAASAVKKTLLGDAFAALNLDASARAAAAAGPSYPDAAGATPAPPIPCVLADITDGRHFTLQAEADRERIEAVNASLDALLEANGLAHATVPDLRRGRVLAALFDEGEDGGKRWYRARVDGKAAPGSKTSVSPGMGSTSDETGLERWEVTYVDYGNRGVVTVLSMHPLDASTGGHPPFARRGGLAYLRVPGVKEEAGVEAAAALSETAFGRPLLAHAHGVDTLAPEGDGAAGTSAPPRCVKPVAPALPLPPPFPRGPSE